MSSGIEDIMARLSLKKPYEIRQSPGKGRGLFTTRDIAKGELVMVDQPLAIIGELGRSPTLQDVNKALATMSIEQRKAFSTLSDAGGSSDDKLMRIYQTNALGHQGAGSGCICLNISMINHSCRPNTTWSGPRGDDYIVTATTFIPKDAEITANYASYFMYYTRAQRQVVLRTMWGFTCTCEVCSSPSHAQRTSDARRAFLLGLRGLLEMATGGLQLTNYDLALKGSNGKGLARFNPWRVFQYTDAELTFAWFLVAKLMEAEKIQGQELSEAYTSAANSLKKRMMAEGHAGCRLTGLEAWFANVRHWEKAEQDAEIVYLCPKNYLVYAEPGKKAWKFVNVCVARAV